MRVQWAKQAGWGRCAEMVSRVPDRPAGQRQSPSDQWETTATVQVRDGVCPGDAMRNRPRTSGRTRPAWKEKTLGRADSPGMAMRETGSRPAPRPLTSQVEGLKDRAALAQVWWAWEEGARVSPSFTAGCRISTSLSEPSSTAFPGSRHGGYTLPAGKAGSARGRSPPSEEQSLRTRARPFLCTTFKLRMSFCILRDYKAKRNTSKEMWASKA